MGLGISFDPARIGQANYLYFSDATLQIVPLTNLSPIMLYIPITIKNSFRLEPSFGLFSSSTNNTTSSTSPNTGYPQMSSTDLSVTTVGIRATYISSLTNSLSLYTGPRLDISFVSSTSEYSNFSANMKQGYKTNSIETDVTIGAITGAEYFPTPQFSIGGEVSLNYVTFGNPDIINEQVPPPPPPEATYTTERKKHALRTDALFFLRWYFIQLAP